jgi:short-subunit dehydrogenase
MTKKILSIFITGATSGIGLALAHFYKRAGHRVGISGRNLSKLKAEELTLFECFEFDVRDRDAVLRNINNFSKDGLDIIIANAGISVGQKNKKPDFGMAKAIIDTNYIGTLNTFEAALEYFFEVKKGHLVAVASVAGLVGLPGASSYSASKAAVIKLCESYSLDLKSFGIEVSCICPGFIDTPLTRKNKHPMPFLMSADLAAEKIAWAIANKKSLFIFPFMMKIAITFLEKIPRCLYRSLMRVKAINYSKESR